jgi:hypothetical protein
MQVDAGVAAPDAALLIFACAKESSKETHPNALPAARGYGGNRGWKSRAKTKEK